MARWRTLNKRARRRHERDAQAVRDLERLLEHLESGGLESQLTKVFQDLGKAFNKLALAMREAAVETSRRMAAAWQPLDPKYTDLRRLRLRNQWPDVVLEDILDAEYIEEP